MIRWTRIQGVYHGKIIQADTDRQIEPHHDDHLHRSERDRMAVRKFIHLPLCGVYSATYLALIALYLYAWKIAITKPKGFLIALIAFALDTLFFVFSISTTFLRWDVMIAIATHGLILYHLFTAYREFKQHPEAVEIPKVKHK